MYQIRNVGYILKTRRELLNARLNWLRVGPNVFFLGLTSLLTDISSEMVSTTLPLYLLFGLGLAPLQFGFIDGLYQGAAVFIQVASGLTSDRRRLPKLVATVGYSFSAVCKIGLLIVGGRWLAVSTVIFLDRVGKGIRTAPRDSLIAASSISNRMATAFGVHRAMDTAGATLGPLLATALLTLTPDAYDSVFVVSFCLALVGVAVIILLVEDTNNRNEQTVHPAVSWRTIGQLLSNSNFRNLIIASSVLALMTLSDSFIYLTLQRHLGFKLLTFPLLYVSTALVFMICAIPIGKLADRVGRPRVFMGGYGLLAISYSLLLLPGANWLLALAVLSLLGLYYAATDGVLMALASDILPEASRTTGLAILNTGIGLGRLLASLLYGAIWQRSGPDAATKIFFIGIVIAVIAAVMILVRIDINRKQTA